jgi:hypothetical protein
VKYPKFLGAGFAPEISRMPEGQVLWEHLGSDSTVREHVSRTEFLAVIQAGSPWLAALHSGARRITGKSGAIMVTGSHRLCEDDDHGHQAGKGGAG